MEFENLPESELDKRLAVKFEKRAVLNKFKSKEEGRQVFDDVEYISILIPGDNTTRVERRATEDDKKRFSVIWERYQQRQSTMQNGLALALLPGLSPAQIENLHAYNIHTIEQLSGITEKAIQKIPHSRGLVTQAVKFLEGQKYTVKLEEKIKELEQRLAEKEHEPINNNTERDGRDGSGGNSDNGNRKQRQVRKKVSGVAQ